MTVKITDDGMSWKLPGRLPVPFHPDPNGQFVAKILFGQSATQNHGEEFTLI